MSFEPSFNHNCPYKHEHEKLKTLKMLPQNPLKSVNVYERLASSRSDCLK